MQMIPIVIEFILAMRPKNLETKERGNFAMACY